jgi:hypothetical protein
MMFRRLPILYRCCVLDKRIPSTLLETVSIVLLLSRELRILHRASLSVQTLPMHLP